jgi:probable rRNA maturation factor
MTVKINSENRNRKRKIDLSKTKKVAEIILKTLKKDNVELNVIFFSNQKIRALNRVYLGMDTATDVIAFTSGEWIREGKRLKGKRPDGGRTFLGDIAISSDKAAQNAGIYRVGFEEEIALCLIHGILHLIGYGDTSKESRKAMRKKEDELLQKVRKFL